MAVVVDLPLLPVTPSVRLRLNCQKSDISLVSSTHVCAGAGEEGTGRRHGGIDHDQIGVDEVFLDVAAEVIGIDGTIGQFRRAARRGLRP